jgi:hypothetical protein
MVRGKGNSKVANVSADGPVAVVGAGAVIVGADAATGAGMVMLGVKTHRSTTNAAPPSSMNAM